ncbi:hypothetical protein AC579_7876 [Pseudocercospora musae]|uniref:Alcohol dehydrogenase-like C-terminal domain-containing protein n=1 Tax=Pseudocercospora musae TaxID=113226 RepID=A0A139I7C8_9PEZI|nr:hypothetical protein AC579_7876 [Pseudocercospora musae]
MYPGISYAASPAYPDQKMYHLWSSGSHVLGRDDNEVHNFRETPDTVAAVHNLTSGGPNVVIVSAASSATFAQAAFMLRISCILCMIGILPGGGRIETGVAEIAIKGSTVKGNLPKVFVRHFRDLPALHEERENGDIAGRVVLKIEDD